MSPYLSRVATLKQTNKRFLPAPIAISHNLMPYETQMHQQVTELQRLMRHSLRTSAKFLELRMPFVTSATDLLYGIHAISLTNVCVYCQPPHFSLRASLMDDHQSMQLQILRNCLVCGSINNLRSDSISEQSRARFCDTR